MSYIIKFGSREARDKYEELVNKNNVETTQINDLFIGLITKHPSIQSFDTERKRLGRVFIASSLGILGFERDQLVTASQRVQPSPPWHLDRIDQRFLPLDGIFTYSSASNTVNVYVVDSGVRVSHSEFQGRATGAYSPSGLTPGQDCHGHGTHVAGLIAGRTYGVTKNARIYDVRVLDCNGSGSTSAVILGLDWISRNGRKPGVVNLSLGSSYSQAVNDAVTSLTERGITVVVAAGNEATDACTKSPSSAESAITVGSSNQYDRRSSFSNYGGCVNIYAPGEGIQSASASSDTSSVVMSGTSMASPIVAGVAASILQSNPSLSPAQVFDNIRRRATSSVTTSIRPLIFFETSREANQCQSGYIGDSCNIPVCFGVPGNSRNVCSGKGLCSSPNLCRCSYEYEGPTCAERKSLRQPEEAEEPDEEYEDDDEDDWLPGKGKLIAKLNNPSFISINNVNETYTIDASLSHATLELLEETRNMKRSRSKSSEQSFGDQSVVSQSQESFWISVLGTLPKDFSLKSKSVPLKKKGKSVILKRLINIIKNEQSQTKGATNSKSLKTKEFDQSSSESNAQSDPEQESTVETSGVSTSNSNEAVDVSMVEISGKTIGTPEEQVKAIELLFDSDIRSLGEANNDEEHLKKLNSKIKFDWSCKTNLTNSEANPVCDSLELGTESKIELSSETLQKLNNLGPVLFTVTTSLKRYISDASMVIDISSES